MQQWILFRLRIPEWRQKPGKSLLSRSLHYIIQNYQSILVCSQYFVHRVKTKVSKSVNRCIKFSENIRYASLAFHLRAAEEGDDVEIL